MKLYYHPASTTCRPIMLFAEESRLALDYQLVDIFTGEQYQDAYTSINPCHMVPVLEDGDFRLTESSAILKYLADKIDSPAYPKDLQARARVNERMDFVNTQVSREFTYGFVYPQLLPIFKRKDEAVQAATLEWGRERSRGWLTVLDRHFIGRNRYLCGDAITIADYFAVAFIALGEAIRCDFSPYPNIRRWLGDMHGLRSWRKVNEAIDGFAASLKDTQFEPL
ncbi:MAG TPA: glutathione S-transferase family protein [Kofleriaceae bacterium]|nr:glutathione S-transferase family protein [Kofleriaceae bacterium]